MTQSAQSMTNRTLSGLFWMSLATAVNFISLLLVLIILARLLTPADFGLAAAALMVIGFSAIFSDFGIGPGIVQRPDLQTRHLGTGFTLSLVLGFLLGVVTWGAAPLVAGFFQLDELTPILRTLAWVFPVQGFTVVAESLLQRELRFRCLAGLEMTTMVVGNGLVGITLALLGFGPWALVGAHMAQIFLRTVLLSVLRPHSVWPLLERGACRELLYFGGGFTASRFCNYLAGQGEHLVIGRCLGAVALGVYGRAYQLMAGPAVLFGNVLDRVLFPAMVHVQNQPTRLAYAYRRGIALIALVIVPISAVMVSLAPEVVHVLLGREWHAVVLPLQILAVGMLFRTGCKISDSLVRATGAVYRRTWRQTTYAVMVIFGAWVGQAWGVEGVAVAVLGTLALNFFLMAHLALCLAAMSWRTFAAAHLPGLALAAAAGVPVALAAALLRAWDFSAPAVLVLSMAALLPSILAVVALPGIFLGRDGQWIARKVMGFLHLGTQPVVEKGPELATPGPDTAPASALSGHRSELLSLLTQELASRGVRYCRWKSRLDLPRVLAGKGDLDLLVDRNDIGVFLSCAEQIGFTRAVNCFETTPSSEVHLFGLNEATGVLVHLHVNISLRDTYEHSQLPSLEEFVLRHSSPATSPDALAGMPVVQPAAELIVFVLHAMARYARLRDLPSLLRGRRTLEAKLQTMLTAETCNGWYSLLKLWMPSVPPSVFENCLIGLSEARSWLCRFLLARTLRAHVTPCLRAADSRITKSTQRVLIGLRSSHALVRSLCWRLLNGPGTPKRLPSAGAVIAFIGPDGCGKSTMVGETASWLGKVFPVKTAHLGKPPATWLTWLPNRAGKLLGWLAPRLRTVRQQEASGGLHTGKRSLLYRIRAVLLAWDRRALAVRLQRRARRGWIIICDRYPSVVVGAPDSARLKAPELEPGMSWLSALLARVEQRLYQAAPVPNIVIRLHAPLALAIDRNKVRQKAGKESDEYITRRHNDFLVPHFADTPIYDLDTATSRVESAMKLRRLLWERLARLEQRRLQAHQVVLSQARRDNTGKGTSSKARTGPLVVEFIGVTGVGKSTLVAAVVESLSTNGLQVRWAEDLILARYGLSFSRHPKVRSGLILLVSLRQFAQYFLTRGGARLSRLAFASIRRGMGSFGVGASLLRNFLKRIGSHLLLEKIRDETHCDVVVWDEGVVHAAHNLFVHTATVPRKEDIEQFGRLVPRPDLLVWVTAPTAQSAEVLLHRGHSRVRMSSIEAAAFVEAHAFADRAQITFEVLSSVPGLRERIYRVNNPAHGPGAKDALIQGRAAVIGEFLMQRLGGTHEVRPAKALPAPLQAVPAPLPPETPTRPSPPQAAVYFQSLTVQPS